MENSLVNQAVRSSQRTDQLDTVESDHTQFHEVGKISFFGIAV